MVNRDIILSKLGLQHLLNHGIVICIIFCILCLDYSAIVSVHGKHNMLHESESKLKDIGKFLAKLAEHSESVYWLCSPDFSEIIYVSPSYEKIWGRPRESLYSNPDLWLSDVILEEEHEHNPYQDMIKNLIKQGPEAIFRENYCITRPDGETRWIYDRGFPIYDTDGTCYGITGVAVNVTKEKLAEESLRKAKEQAEAMNAMRSEFINNIEHDIRTPFNGIWGLSCILSGQENDPNKKNMLLDIANCAKELLDYCNSILEFSKIESSSLPNTQKNFSLYDLVTSIITMETPPAKLKEINISFDYAEGVPKVIKGDYHRTHRIILNLFSNAVKFTEKGFIKCKVNLLKRFNQRDIIIQISIEDSGIGIPQDKQSIIYQKFSKISPSNQGVFKGQGLGLCIVNYFVNDMDGDIHLTSTPGKGTRFIIELPYKMPYCADIVDE